jgi:integrase/recombinase XerD
MGAKGFAAVVHLSRRSQTQRGGQDKRGDLFDRTGADALAVWRETYLESLLARNYSEKTVESRRFALKLFFAWAAERDVTRASQVTRPMLEAYQRHRWKCTRPDGRPMSWSTHHGQLGTLKDFFRWLTRQDVLLHNPASELELPRPEYRLPAEALTRAEIERLCAVPVVADPLGVRDRAMLELFYSSGLRRAELCRAGLTEVNLERRTLTVRRGKGKKDRVVPLGERACHWLERYLVEVRPRLSLDPHEPAFFLTGYGTAFNPDVVSRQVSAWMKAAGLTKKGSCHLLRHTCALHMLEGGADIRYIQQLLGHASLETTAIYTEISIKQLQEVHARCHPGRMENPASVPDANPAA